MADTKTMADVHKEATKTAMDHMHPGMHRPDKQPDQPPAKKGA